MEIVRERLEREFDLDLLVTAPNVAYRVQEKNADWIEVHNPSEFPREIEEVEEPYVAASIIVPKEYVGAVMELNNERRGTFGRLEYLSPERVHLTHELPLAEIVLDYYDQLKSRTRGYASLDYEPIGLRPSNLVKLDVLLGGDPVDALSMVVHKDKAYNAGRALTERLQKQIPRQQFEVAIQASVGSNIIARESVKAVRKDVIAKCYGGDITRKRKLLEKQKAGKKRMKQVGRIEVPQEAFLSVLQIGEDGRG
jgi:GTP-binding protein LepA